MAKAKSPIVDLGRRVKRKCHHLDSLPCLLKHIPNPHSPCNRCGNAKENWLCLDCKVVLCSRSVNSHNLKHYQNNNHCLFLSYRDLSVFCYRCCLEAEVNDIRLILVQEGCNFSLKQQPKVAYNDDVASSKKSPTNISREVPWEGHLVDESYVELLSEMKKSHPKTFEHLSFHIPALNTSALNTLGEFYTLFASKRVAEMTIDEITHFGDMLRDLEVLRFNVEWLRERLDLIKEMRFNSPLVDEYEESLRNMKAKQKELEELKLLCDSKAVLVKDKFGFLAENVSTRPATDGLLAESTNTSFKSE